MILCIEDQDFSPSYDLAPRQLPPPPISRQPVVFLCVAGRAYPRERGRGWGRSQIIWRRESLVLYKSFNILVFCPSVFPSVVSSSCVSLCFLVFPRVSPCCLNSFWFLLLCFLAFPPTLYPCVSFFVYLQQKSLSFTFFFQQIKLRYNVVWTVIQKLFFSGFSRGCPSGPSHRGTAARDVCRRCLSVLCPYIRSCRIRLAVDCGRLNPGHHNRGTRYSSQGCGRLSPQCTFRRVGRYRPACVPWRVPSPSSFRS